jgi:hypothetical protein
MKYASQHIDALLRDAKKRSEVRGIAGELSTAVKDVKRKATQ